MKSPPAPKGGVNEKEHNFTDGGRTVVQRWAHSCAAVGAQLYENENEYEYCGVALRMNSIAF